MIFLKLRFRKDIFLSKVIHREIEVLGSIIYYSTVKLLKIESIYFSKEPCFRVNRMFISTIK